MLELALEDWREKYMEAEGLTNSYRVLNATQITQLGALCPLTLADLAVIEGFGSAWRREEGGITEGRKGGMEGRKEGHAADAIFLLVLGTSIPHSCLPSLPPSLQRKGRCSAWVGPSWTSSTAS